MFRFSLCRCISSSYFARPSPFLDFKDLEGSEPDVMVSIVASPRFAHCKSNWTTQGQFKRLKGRQQRHRRLGNGMRWSQPRRWSWSISQALTAPRLMPGVRQRAIGAMRRLGLLQLLILRNLILTTTVNCSRLHAFQQKCETDTIGLWWCATLWNGSCLNAHPCFQRGLAKWVKQTSISFFKAFWMERSYWMQRLKALDRWWTRWIPLWCSTSFDMKGWMRTCRSYFSFTTWAWKLCPRYKAGDPSEP